MTKYRLIVDTGAAEAWGVLYDTEKDALEVFEHIKRALVAHDLLMQSDHPSTARALFVLSAVRAVFVQPEEVDK